MEVCICSPTINHVWPAFTVYSVQSGVKSALSVTFKTVACSPNVPYECVCIHVWVQLTPAESFLRKTVFIKLHEDSTRYVASGTSMPTSFWGYLKNPQATFEVLLWHDTISALSASAGKIAPLRKMLLCYTIGFEEWGVFQFIDREVHIYGKLRPFSITGAKDVQQCGLFSSATIRFNTSRRFVAASLLFLYWEALQ